ncbi:carbohydrate kinase family protein [Paraglaciecola sp.]|uniref:carbohydrate kinase family protein n=1 Tax=Paraglaciecola sp. TaxID=1920173 RepID=UPI003EF30569
MKAACFSVAAMDYFPQQAKFFPGGNALNQCIRLKKLGVSTSFLGAIGDDENGKQIHSLLKRNGVDVDLLKVIKGRTANNRIVNDDSGERFGETNAWHGGVYDNFRINDEQWRHIHDFDIWTTHASCPNFKQTITRKTNAVLCVDYLHLPEFQDIAETIDNVDIAYVGGDIDMVKDLTDLSNKKGKLIVLTLGEKGSIAFHQGQTFRQPALPTNVVDTTGCGDAFQAGFTCSYVKLGDIEKALKAGAELGALGTKHYGGIEW